MTHDASPEVTRALYDALMDARPRIVRLERICTEMAATAAAARVRETLDRIDGALADAADYLPPPSATPTRKDTDE